MASPVVPIPREGQLRALPTNGFSAGASAQSLNLPAAQPVDFEARALQRAGDTFERDGLQIADQAKRHADQVVNTQSSNWLGNWQNENVIPALGRQGTQAISFQDVYDKFDKEAGEYRETLANDDQKESFDEQSGRTRQGIKAQLEQHSLSEQRAVDKAGTDSAIKTWSNNAILNYQDPTAHAEALGNIVAVRHAFGQRNGLPAEVVDAQIASDASDISFGTFKLLAESDPAGALAYAKTNMGTFGADHLVQVQGIVTPLERKYQASTLATSAIAASQPKVTADDTIPYVMNDFEGGDKLATDSNGAQVKFGINKAKNPDVDVANLTPEKAAAIYKERYWDAAGIGELPADIRLAAYDAAVNQGVGFAKKIITESGGDFQKLMQLRADKYAELAKSDPVQFNSNVVASWQTRLAKISANHDALMSQLPNEAEAVSYVNQNSTDPAVTSDALDLINKNSTAMRNAQKAAQDNAAGAAWEYQRRGLPVPATVEAQMSRQDVDAMHGSTPLDPALYGDLRGRISAGQPVDLNSYRWRLPANKWNELADMQADPAKQGLASTVDKTLKDNTARVIGKATPKDPSDFEKLDMFRASFDRSVQAYAQQNGKQPDAREAQRMVDDLMMNVDVKGQFRDSPKYAVPPGTQFEAPKVSGDYRYLRLGKEVSADELSTYLTRQLQDRGITVTQDALDRERDRLKNTGQITVKLGNSRLIPAGR